MLYRLVYFVKSTRRNGLVDVLVGIAYMFFSNSGHNIKKLLDTLSGLVKEVVLDKI
jgi:hypothetical protein